LYKSFAALGHLRHSGYSEVQEVIVIAKTGVAEKHPAFFSAEKCL